MEVIDSGKGSGDDLTYPQKIVESENNKFVIFPATSAVSIPAIIMLVIVLAKIRNVGIKGNISSPLSAI